MADYVFSIPEITPSNNRLLRMHWTERRALRDDWYYLVRLATQDKTIPPAIGPEDFRRVGITSYRISLADEDNLKGGAKPLIDALVACLFIFDDGPRFADIKVRQEPVRRRRDQRTEILITCCRII